jgi:CRISPR/Cas system-associated exonuclease Cas4 (RecB family)
MDHRQTYLNTYEECKYLFYKQVVAGEESCSAEARDLGSVVHEAIRRMLADGENMVEAAIAYSIQKLKETEKIIPISDESVRIAKWMVRKAVEKAQTFGSDSLIEEYIEFEHIEENDLFSPLFHSQIDIFDKSTGTIYDWKTGRLRAKKRQLYVYAYMLKRKYGIIAKKGVFIYLRNGTIEEFDITPEDIAEAEKWVKETIKDIENKIENLLFDNNVGKTFLPTPNTRCKTCLFSIECTKVLSTSDALQLETFVKSPDEIEDSEDIAKESSDRVSSYKTEGLDIGRLIKDIDEEPEIARLLGAEIIRQESALKLMKNALKKFVEANGALQVDSKLFDIYQTISWSFDTDSKRNMATEILTTFGLNPWKYFDLSSTSKKALQKDKNMTDADLDDFLKKFGKQKSSKRFDCRTINEPINDEATKTT